MKKEFDPELKKLFEQCTDKFDLIDSIQFIVEVFMMESKEYYDPNLRYTKDYFAGYYNVSTETFNKWIRLFCPKVFSQKYSAKRSFSQQEFNQIIKDLGQCDKKYMRTYSRNELSEVIYGDDAESKPKGKSWKYREFDNELKQTVKHYDVGINKFPPKIANDIMIELIERDFSDSIDRSQTVFTAELKKRILIELITRYANRSTEEVYQERKQMIGKIRDFMADPAFDLEDEDF